MTFVTDSIEPSQVKHKCCLNFDLKQIYTVVQQNLVYTALHLFQQSQMIFAGQEIKNFFFKN